MILLPVMVQVLLTLIVYIMLNAAKMQAWKRGEVDAARRGLHDDAWPDNVIRINNNIRNQFETPVLFYVLSFMLLAVDGVTVAALVLAWLFVATRAFHAYVHIANHLLLRRRSFVFGCVILVAMAGLAAAALGGLLMSGGAAG
jgi:hypothetical protein